MVPVALILGTLLVLLHDGAIPPRVQSLDDVLDGVSRNGCVDDRCRYRA